MFTAAFVPRFGPYRFVEAGLRACPPSLFCLRVVVFTPAKKKRGYEGVFVGGLYSERG
jgi:hypothetical protein